jgi:hypothetical protein
VSVVLGDLIIAPAHSHCYAVIDGPEHANELLSDFVSAGLAASERITIIGLTDQQAFSLLARMNEDGADPHSSVREGQLSITGQSLTTQVDSMTAQQVTDQVLQAVSAATRDGYGGIRIGGMLSGLNASPHERTMTRLVRQHPVTALCLFHPHAPAAVRSQADRLHDGRVPSTAVFDDADVRVSAVSRKEVRLAGRVHPGNQARVLSVLTQTARKGRLVIDAASLRDIDPGSLRAILTSGLRLTLRRPSPMLQQLAGELAGQFQPAQPSNTMARNGIPVPGQTAPAVVTNLVWRTFGPQRPDRAESVLDWAGLAGNAAQAISDVATRHHIAAPTLNNRIRQISNRGAQTPLSPLQLRDATRATQPTEDHLSRQRTAGLLDLPSPRSEGPI